MLQRCCRPGLKFLPDLKQKACNAHTGVMELGQASFLPTQVLCHDYYRTEVFITQFLKILKYNTTVIASLKHGTYCTPRFWILQNSSSSKVSTAFLREAEKKRIGCDLWKLPCSSSPVFFLPVALWRSTQNCVPGNSQKMLKKLGELEKMHYFQQTGKK